MAFGDLKGTLTGSGTSITASNSITGSVAVSVGDLIFVAFAEQTNLTATTVSDNLGNTYTATNAGTDAGGATGRAYYSRVTTGGTLTSVAVVASSSTDDYAGIVGVFEGPFKSSPLDQNPANATGDLSSPFTCPATGTLTQADEVVICWVAANTNTVWTASSPNLLAGMVTPSNQIKIVLGYQTVAATTTVSPEFAGSNPGVDVLGTSTFMKDAGAVFAGTITTTFGQTGDLAATSVHAGTSAVVFGQTGALKGNAAAAGTTTLVFAQTGAFAAKAEFVSTTTITFDQNGDFVAGASGDVSFAGTTAVTFGQTGDFGAQSVFTANATIAFSQTGDLKAGVSLLGTIPIIFDQSGDFTAAQGPQIAPVHRYAYDPRDEHERRLREDREELQRIIDRAWRIANGEVDPVTLKELPPPIPVDLSVINAALAGAQEAQDRQVIEAFVAEQKMRLEDEAIAVLLLA